MSKSLLGKNNDKSGVYNTDSSVIFGNVNLKSSLFDYSDVYILAKQTITAVIQEAVTAAKGMYYLKTGLHLLTP